MKTTLLLLLLFLFCTPALRAQPAYAPSIRAERETQWMTDSLHINPDQAKKAQQTLLHYNEEMDKTDRLVGNKKAKTQKALDNKKNTAIKGILNKEQYRAYIKHVQWLKKHTVKNSGRHQPM